jgi:hypothetical protein
MTDLNINVPDVQNYLSSAGWRRIDGGRVAEVWTSPRLNSVPQVLVPLIETAPDYRDRISILTSDLASIESRSADEVGEEIARQFVDIGGLKAANEELIDDSIPLNAGYRMFIAARQLMVAAAGATIRRQGSYGRAMPKEAYRHVRSVRLGHTRRGSYIVPIISQARIPMEAEGDVHYRLDTAVEESRFDRRVMVTLAHSLEVLENIAVQASALPQRREVYDAVNEGVSRELCNAVYGVISTGDVDELTIDFKWAAGVPKPRGLHQASSFPHEAARPLAEVARLLKQTVASRDRVIFGKVRLLRDVNGELGGLVEVETVIDGRVRPVRMLLNEQQYEIAYQCHRRRPVVVRGELDLSPGRQATMVVSGFEPDLSLDIDSTPPT